MRFYNQTHRYYCGVDLHARSMFVHATRNGGSGVWRTDAGRLGYRSRAEPRFGATLRLPAPPVIR